MISAMLTTRLLMALSNIITVGAHDENLAIIPSSNYGKNSVDIAAPGHRIRSPFLVMHLLI